MGYSTSLVIKIHSSTPKAMIKHIVLFALEGFSSDEAKAQHLGDLKVALEGLVGQIDSLMRMEVYLNENPREQYDLMLEAVTASMDDLASYSAHPLHQEIVARLIKPYLKARACVDFSL